MSSILQKEELAEIANLIKASILGIEDTYMYPDDGHCWFVIVKSIKSKDQYDTAAISPFGLYSVVTKAYGKGLTGLPTKHTTIKAKDLKVIFDLKQSDELKASDVIENVSKLDFGFNYDKAEVISVGCIQWKQNFAKHKIVFLHDDYFYAISSNEETWAVKHYSIVFPEDITSKRRDTEMFCQRFGHADITLVSGDKSSKEWEMSLDGYSIGYRFYVGNHKTDKYYYSNHLRCNIRIDDLDEPHVEFISKIRHGNSNPLTIQCISTDEKYLECPDINIQQDAGCTTTIKYSEGSITVDPPNCFTIRPYVDVEEIKSDKPNCSYEFHPLISAHSTRKENLIINDNFAIGYMRRNEEDNVSLLGWISVGLRIGNRLYMIAGRTGEETDRLVFTKRSYLELYSDNLFNLQYQTAVLEGHLKYGPMAELKYKIDVGCGGFDLATNPTIDIFLESDIDEEISGTVEISSQINFGFFKDGPIEFTLNKGQKLHFHGAN